MSTLKTHTNELVFSLANVRLLLTLKLQNRSALQNANWPKVNSITNVLELIAAQCAS